MNSYLLREVVSIVSVLAVTVTDFVEDSLMLFDEALEPLFLLCVFHSPLYLLLSSGLLSLHLIIRAALKKNHKEGHSF